MLGIFLLAFITFARRAETAQEKVQKTRESELSRTVITRPARVLHIKVLLMETAAQRENNMAAIAGNHMRSFS